MTPDEDIKAAIAAAVTAANKASKAAVEAAALEATNFKKENGELKAQHAAFTAAAKADKVKHNRAAITSIFEAAVRTRLITPAQRMGFTKMFKVDSDEDVLALNIGDVEAAVKVSLDEAARIMQAGKSAFSRTIMGVSSALTEAEEDAEFLDEFTKRCSTRAKETGKTTFACMADVVKSDPKFGRRFTSFIFENEGAAE